ncbi:hypothetical protein CU669_19125 [Paramagnetospirillum kuznetsovii]|uniref:Uncharacterized protein n=1 Tax=Paramagnetospirillum kuznetsovii TaxID=2053833 RepID=A0A364NTD9_9PROT|nr:hypothetical protein [Paramagnetospirillum kuznetsovii]RAU20280.1 hypothetical protein CU669_19125 [Paramagnetospirillum kuznetsovii]
MRLITGFVGSALLLLVNLGFLALKGVLTLSIFGAIIGIPIAFLAGGFETWQAATRGDVVEMPCSRLQGDMPEGTWVSLSDCRIDFNGHSLYQRGDEVQAPIANDGSSRFKLNLVHEGDVLLANAMIERTPPTLTFNGVSPKFQPPKNDALEAALPRLVEEHSAPRSLQGKLHWETDRLSNVRTGVITEGTPPELSRGLILMGPGAFILLMLATRLPRFRKEYEVRQDAKRRREVVSEWEKTAALQSLAPEGAILLDVSPMVRHIRRITKIGAAIPIAFLSLFLVVFAAGTIIQAFSGHRTLLENAWTVLELTATLFVFGGAVLLFPFRYLPLWLPIGGLMWSCFNILKLVFAGELAGAAINSELTPGLWYLATALAAYRHTSFTVPELGLGRVNIVNRPISIRPFPPLSARTFSSLGFFLQGMVFAYIGFIALALMFAIEKTIKGLPIKYWQKTLALTYRCSQAARLRRRYASPDARTVLARDTRPPVLLLRSFIDDELRMDDSGFLDNFYRSDRTFEEVVTDQLWGFGPVIAIGRPSEEVPMSGAVREYVSHDTWQQRVATLVDQAAMIVMILGPTPGFGWELQRMVQMKCLDKVVLVMPPLSDGKVEDRWKTLVAELGLAEGAAEFASAARIPGGLCVVENGTLLVVLRSQKRGLEDYGVAIDLAARSIRAQRARPKSD